MGDGRAGPRGEARRAAGRVMGELTRTIQASAIFEPVEGSGMLPTRIVLREIGGFQPFTTHLKVYPRDGGPLREPYLIWGHYFKTLEAAEADYHKRLLHLRREPHRTSHFNEARAMEPEGEGSEL